ncbi:AF4/FMR2 family member 4 [Cyclospora cayetanensis]|uniref:AF4/FMR2 family member 4 n=1 Tax=Cyclospora cayetanensis TaxID=88456 RepID=A0A6P6RZZ5_9EIME|nr:AF4/FMR2 family member 4 [Cyclospora cayetanensis]
MEEKQCLENVLAESKESYTQATAPSAAASAVQAAMATVPPQLHPSRALGCIRCYFTALRIAGNATPDAVADTPATAGTVSWAATPATFSSQRQHFSASVGGKAVAASAKAASQAGVLRAGTLLLNDPPPEYEVSVHRGLKVQASLMLQRLPLTYKEPEHERQFRLYKEEWERSTGNTTVLSDEITYMQLPGHFLETQQQQQQREKQQEKTGDAQVSELDMLLQQQGLTLQRHKTKRQKQHQQEQAADSGSAASTTGEREEQSLSRSPERVLLLLVRYANGWQLPVEDRRHGQTMRQTLARLCMQQLGLREAPFMVGFAPAAVQHIRNKPRETVQGRQVFFYRAYHVFGQPQVCPPANSPVCDWAWLPAEEAKHRMSLNAFSAIRDALLLG